MDILWIAIIVDMMIYAIVGALIAYFGRNRLPAPWNEPGILFPLILALGALITLISFPHWRVYPG